MASVVVATTAALLTQAVVCRDSRQWPFSRQSIWNQPVGEAAIFQPANLYGGRNAHADSASCTAPQDNPATRIPCPGSFGGMTEADCQVLGCCFSPTPQPDPNQYPYCFTQKVSITVVHAY